MNHEPEIVAMIIPTIMIPLTLLSVGISVVATFIAGFFGIKLKAEGPKKLLELLLKPRILLSALLFNIVTFGAIRAWTWWKNYPRLIVSIQKTHKAVASSRKYSDVTMEANIYKTLEKTNPQAPTDVEQLWKFDVGTGVFSSGVSSGGSYFVGSRQGFVFELDENSGELIRKFYIGSPATPRLSIWNNSLYVGEGVHDLHHARIYRFDLASGELLGSYTTKGHIEAQSILGTYNGEHTLFVPSGSDGLHAIDPNTLALKWHVNFGHIDSAVAVADGKVFIGNGREKNDDKKNKIYAVALDFANGKELWKHELSASSWMTPIIAGNDVCYVSGEIYFPSERGQVSCYVRNTGEISTSFNFDEPIAAMPIVLDNSIIVSTLKGRICRMNLSSKSKEWCTLTQSGGDGFSSAAYDTSRNVIVYSSYDKGLFVLNPKSGEILKNWIPSEDQGIWQKNYAAVTITEQGRWMVNDYKSTLRSLSPSYKVLLGVSSN